MFFLSIAYNTTTLLMVYPLWCKILFSVLDSAAVHATVIGVVEWMGPEGRVIGHILGVGRFGIGNLPFRGITIAGTGSACRLIVDDGSYS